MELGSLEKATHNYIILAESSATLHSCALISEVLHLHGELWLVQRALPTGIIKYENLPFNCTGNLWPDFLIELPTFEQGGERTTVP